MAANIEMIKVNATYWPVGVPVLTIASTIAAETQAKEVSGVA